ncbi:MAG: nuclear transport factor 2 family protein [Polyangiales bacterium]
MSQLSDVVEGLFRGDADAVLAHFGDTPRVNAQRGGLAHGRVAISEWVADTAAWFKELDGKLESGVDIVGERAVYDTSLMIKTGDGVVDLPFVVVADLVGGKIKELRTYHSSWPYTGGHSFRAPPVGNTDLSHLPQAFGDYIDRLTRADVEPILASFSDDAYVREPSGNRYKYQGADVLAEFYRGHIADAPPARFDLRTCTNDGNVTAVEYAFAYGDVPLVGGVCIMEHHDGKISAVRITDDVGV